MPSLPFSGEIRALYVLKRAQRRGVGRMLMAADGAGSAGAGPRVRHALGLSRRNAPARRFYEALGGKEVARREQQRDGFRAIGVAYGWEDLTVLI